MSSAFPRLHTRSRAAADPFAVAQSELSSEVKSQLEKKKHRVFIISQNQFYLENLPREEGLDMANYDHPGKP